MRQARQDAMNYVHPTLKEQQDTECIKHGYWYGNGSENDINDIFIFSFLVSLFY